MAGSSLAGDDLWALLCAGFEVREKIPQHRVSTEGGETGGTLQRVRVVFLQVMAAQRVARSAAKRSGRQVLGGAGAGKCVRGKQTWADRRRCARGVGWSKRSDLVPSLWRSRRSTERRGSSLWCFCCACCGPRGWAEMM